MSQSLYEVLFLAVPEITSDEISLLESNFEKMVQEYKSSLVSFDRWGKYRLAYPIRKNEYGIYFLIRFEQTSLEQSAKFLEAIRMFFAVKYNELIMRYILVNLAKNKSLEYQRPESLEEAPTRDIDSFLKENKMTGLLHKSFNHTNKGSSETVDLGSRELKSTETN